MKVDFKKLTASAISVAMLASLGGCAMFDKDDEAVLKVAEDYATAVTKIKAGDIVELLADPDDDLQSAIEEFTSVDADIYGDDYMTPKQVATCHGEVIFDTRHGYEELLPKVRSRYRWSAPKRLFRKLFK